MKAVILTILATSFVAAQQTTTCPAAYCDFQGTQSTVAAYAPYKVSSTAKYLSKEGCGNACLADAANCRTYSTGEGQCRLYKATLARVAASSKTGPRFFFDKCCASKPICKVTGTDTLTSKQYTTLSSCQALCGRIASCTAYAYAANVCQLYTKPLSSGFTANARGALTYYEKSCTSTSTTGICGVKGTDTLTPVRYTTASTCQNVCKRISTCTSFSYGNDVCKLYTQPLRSGFTSSTTGNGLLTYYEMSCFNPATSPTTTTQATTLSTTATAPTTMMTSASTTTTVATTSNNVDPQSTGTTTTSSTSMTVPTTSGMAPTTSTTAPTTATTAPTSSTTTTTTSAAPTTTATGTASTATTTTSTALTTVTTAPTTTLVTTTRVTTTSATGPFVGQPTDLCNLGFETTPAFLGPVPCWTSTGTALEVIPAVDASTGQGYGSMELATIGASISSFTQQASPLDPSSSYSLTFAYRLFYIDSLFQPAAACRLTVTLGGSTVVVIPYGLNLGINNPWKLSVNTITPSAFSQPLKFTTDWGVTSGSTCKIHVDDISLIKL